MFNPIYKRISVSFQLVDKFSLMFPDCKIFRFLFKLANLQLCHQTFTLLMPAKRTSKVNDNSICTVEEETSKDKVEVCCNVPVGHVHVI